MNHEAQAHAFNDWHQKVGGDTHSAFTVWCDSKDLAQRDRDLIWRALHQVDPDAREVA